MFQVGTLAFLLALAATTTPWIGAEDAGEDGGGEDGGGGEDTNDAHITFINFSPEPIPLYWFNWANETFKEVAQLQPYDIVVMETFVEAQFAYDDAVSGERVLLDITEPHDTLSLGIPEDLQVLCTTTKGDLHITVQPTWSPLGAARFLELIQESYFDDCALNRVVPQFLTQFGISASYHLRTHYREQTFPDDAPLDDVPFEPGFMAYAGSGPDSRTAEMFIVMPNTPDHQLEAFGQNPWETPFAYVDPEDLHNVVAQWYSYGDMAPWGEGPDPQVMYQEDGYEYLKRDFPNMDYINTCRIVPMDAVEEEL